MSFISYKYIHWLLLGIIILTSFALTFNSSLHESAIFDETAHIPAGYSYVKYFDYRLNPEHPPLVKALAGLPLVFMDLNFPVASPDWKSEVNGQWAMGNQFLFKSGNDADKIINWARLGPIILFLILIIAVYLWSRQLLGEGWAFLPTALVAFSPNFLAHSHYVTTDIGAALGILAATYYFIRFLEKNERKNLVVSGIIFGLAQLAKFSAVLLIPFFIFIIFAWSITRVQRFSAWEEKIREFVKIFLRNAGALFSIFLIGLATIYCAYFIFTFNYPLEKQRSDTENILAGFAGGSDAQWQTCKLGGPIPLSRRLRCLAEIDIYMSGNKALRPLAQYELGVLMATWRTAGGNTAYFMGQLSAKGWWYYFPVIFALKEPLPSLILIIIAFLATFFQLIRNFRSGYSLKKRFFNYLELNLSEFSMLSFVIFYWAYSMRSPLNIGMRHILPTVPFIYILISQALKKWVMRIPENTGGLLKQIFFALGTIIKTSLKTALIFSMAIWYIMASISAYPHFLSYFNELAGRAENGYRIATDSNYDWGQDLKYLVQFANDPPKGEKIDKIALDYFGGADPKYYLGNKFESWWSAKGNPAEQTGAEKIEWLAVSMNVLQGASAKLDADLTRKPEDEYRWLKKIKNIYQPDYKAGTSIFIYKLGTN